MKADKTRWAGRTTKPVHLMLGGISRLSVHIQNALSHHSLTMARSADSALVVLRLEVNGVKTETGCSPDVISQHLPGTLRKPPRLPLCNLDLGRLLRVQPQSRAGQSLPCYIVRISNTLDSLLTCAKTGLTVVHMQAGGVQRSAG